MAANDQDFFVAKQGDWAADVISNLFSHDSVLASALGTFNFISMAIGGSLVAWLMTRAILETAQHGKVAGKHSEVWFPIRFFLAVGLLVPLPPVNMNAAEYIVVGVARMGIAAGTKIWEVSVGATAGLKPLVLPTSPDAQSLAQGLFRMEACRAIQNQTVAAAGIGATITIVTHEFDDRYVLAADGDEAAGGVPGQCGAVTFSKLAIGEMGDGQVMRTLTARMLDEHIRLAMTMRSKFEAPAQVLATKFLPPHPARPVPEVDFAGAMQVYTNGVMRLAAQMVQTTNSDASPNRAAFERQATEGGWAKAGAWALRLASANEELLRAVHAVPQVSPPKGEWWTGYVFEAQRAALAGVDQWLDQRFRKTVKAMDGNAFAVGADGDPLSAYISPARFKALYTPFLVTDEKSSNPIGEMVRTGHGILNTVWAVYGGYVALKTSAAVAHDGATQSLSGMILNSGTGGSISMLARAAQVVLDSAGPVLFLSLFALFVAGATLAYILPVWPYLIWYFAVVSYFVRVVFAAAAGPTWAISHLVLEGEGVGDRAKGGYNLLLELLLTPIVMMVGLVAGYALMMISVQLFAGTYYTAIQNSISGHFGGVTGLLVYTIVGAAAIMGTVPLSFWIVSKGTSALMEMLNVRTPHVGGDPERDAAAATSKGQSGTDRTGRDAQGAAGRRPGSNPNVPAPPAPAGAGGWAPRMEDSIPSIDRVGRGFEPPPRDN